MKVLVTGANGFLGRALIKKLSLKDGVEIFAVVRDASDALELYDLGANVIEWDLARPKKKETNAIKDVDIVFHLAASLSGSHTDMIVNTVIGTENLLKEIGSKKIKRFVLISSFSVYGLANLKRGAVMDENAPMENNLKLRDSYAIAKIRQERLVRKRCRKIRVPVVILRPGVIYGPGSNYLPMQLGIKIPGICFIYVGGKNYLPLTHVKNCADAIVAAGFKNKIEGEIFNIVDDDLPTQREYLNMYKNEIGPIPRLVRIPQFLFTAIAFGFEKIHKITKGNVPQVITRYRMENYYKFFEFSNDKAKSRLSWKPNVNVKDGIMEMLREERKKRE